jgi:hypothetical protein
MACSATLIAGPEPFGLSLSKPFPCLLCEGEEGASTGSARTEEGGNAPKGRAGKQLWQNASIDGFMRYGPDI